jgi:hypothetical protein
VSIRGVVVMTLNLKASMNANADFVIGSLFELVQDQLERDDSRKDSGVRRRNLRTSERTNGIAAVQMFIKTCDPLASCNGVTKSCGEARRAEQKSSAMKSGS